MSEWRHIPGYEGLYCCSPAGRIKSLERVVKRRDGLNHTVPERVLTPVKHTHGYQQVTLCKNGKKERWLVHRLVALTFLPNPEGLPCINHKNEVKDDNRADNLEWCTTAYNNTYGDRVQRIAEKHRGLKHSPETRRRMSETKKHMPAEYHQKLSAAARGRKATSEARRKMSEYAKTRKRQPDGRWSREICPVSLPDGRN